MSTVAVEDECLWFKHIDGNPNLLHAVTQLEDKQMIVLRIDGTSSVWRRMDQGKNSKPTEGLKPACDLCSGWWRALYKARKGERVSIGLEL